MLGEEQKREIYDTIMNRIPVIVPESLVKPIRSTKVVDGREVQVRVVDEKELQVLENFMKQSNEYEVEASFGFFNQKNFFVPGLFSISQFNRILSFFRGLASDNWWIFQETHDIVEIGKNNIRRIYPNPSVRTTYFYQQKIRGNMEPITNNKYGYRITSSKESDLSVEQVKEMLGESEGVENFRPFVIRKRRRYSFHCTSEQSAGSSVKFDLSVVTETNTRNKTENTKYEVEIERVVPVKFAPKEVAQCMARVIERVLALLSNFKIVKGDTYSLFNSTLYDPIKKQPSELKTRAAEFFYGFDKFPSNIFSLFERRQIVAFHEHLFVEDKRRKSTNYQNPYRLWNNYWNKPTNLKVDDILENNVYAVTEKLDGLRTFALITRNGVYLCNPPNDIYREDSVERTALRDLEGTLVDCEFYKNGLFVFDILFYKFQDLRFEHFLKRYDILRKIKFPRTANGVFILKTYEFEGSLYEKTSKTFDKIERERLHTDGIIYQSMGVYKNTKTRKWKSMDLMTIDFFLQEIEDEEDIFWLLVKSDRSEDGAYTGFLGTEKYPFDGKIFVPGGRFNSEYIDRKVVECKWNYKRQEFEILKFRFDKPCNSFKVAVDVWKDIMNPVFKESILGRTLQIARAYHNRIKNEMLKRYYLRGTELVDIGSGRGGDISKWKQISPKRVFVFEPNKTNYREFERRKESLQPQFPIEHVLGEEGQFLGINDREEIERYFRERKTNIGIVCAFFSLSFVSGDSTEFRSVIETIAKFLIPGGYFIAIIMDGERVKKILEEERDIKRIPQDEVSYFENSCFTIVQNNRFNPDMPHRIEVSINDPDSMVKDQREYLTYTNSMNMYASNYGLEHISSTFLANGNYYLSLSNDAKEFSQLFKCIVYRKLESLDREDLNELTGLTTGDGTSISNCFTTAFIPGPNNLIHAVLRAYKSNYFSLTDEERDTMVLTYRKHLRNSISNNNSRFYELEDGLVYRLYEEKAERLLKEKKTERSAINMFLDDLVNMSTPLRYTGLLDSLGIILHCNIFVLRQGVIEDCSKKANFPNNLFIFKVDSINYTTIVRQKRNSDDTVGIFLNNPANQMKSIFCSDNLPKEISKSVKEKNRLEEIESSIASLQKERQTKQEFFISKPKQKYTTSQEGEVPIKFLELLEETITPPQREIVRKKTSSESTTSKKTSSKVTTIKKKESSSEEKRETSSGGGTSESKGSTSKKKERSTSSRGTTSGEKERETSSKVTTSKRKTHKGSTSKGKEMSKLLEEKHSIKLLEQIRERHNLTDVEYGIFRVYIYKTYSYNINKEEFNEFLYRCLQSDRETIEQLVDIDFNELAGFITTRDAALSKEQRTKKDLDDIDKIFGLYVLTVENLRGLELEDRVTIYESIFGFKLKEGEGKSDRRERFYLVFRKYLSNLSQKGFAQYVEEIHKREWTRNLEEYEKRPSTGKR